MIRRDPATRIVQLAGLVLSLLLLTIVSARATPSTSTPVASPSAENPYAKEFATARSKATSDFERSVLADDLITQAEYHAAVDRFLSCMHDAGLTIETMPSPSTPVLLWYNVANVGPPPGAIVAGSATPEPASGEATPALIPFDEMNAQFDACSMGTTYQIEALYGSIVTNPTNVNRDELIVTCLQMVGLADKTYTAAEFDRTFGREGTIFPFNDHDPRFGSCVNNPNQTGLPLQMVPVPAAMGVTFDGPVATPSASPGA